MKCSKEEMKLKEVFQKTIWLYQAEDIADSASYEEFEISMRFVGKSWPELDLAFFKNNEQSIAFLDTKAYHAFLPAYLLRFADGEADFGILTNATLHKMGFWGSEENEGDYIERHRLFSDEEIDAVFAMLSACEDEVRQHSYEGYFECAIRGWTILKDSRSSQNC